MSFEISEREEYLRRELEPAVEAAYNTHMLRGGQIIGVDLPVETGTLNSLEMLNRLVDLDPEAGLTPELVERTRTSFDAHIAEYEEQGVFLRGPVRKALRMNKATEDNLPWYHARILQGTEGSRAFSELWLPRWTAEEAEHSEVLDDWGSASGALDQKASRHNKTLQLMSGMHVDTSTWGELLAFTDPQEGSTFDAHTNTGHLTDEVGRGIHNPLAGQEHKHQRFFRRILKAHIELDPEGTLPVIAKTWTRFAMPGKKGIDDYEGLALELAVHGVFTLGMVRQQQRESAESLGLLTMSVKTKEAQQAQDRIGKVIDMSNKFNTIPQRIVDQATDEYIEAEKAEGRVPVVLGRTLVFDRKAGKGGKLVVYPEAA